MRNSIKIFLILIMAWSCAGGGYSFTGGDVGNAKTISISLFPNYADLVNPQLSQTFTEKLRDIFIQQTNLEMIDFGGDLNFEGVITEYTVQPLNAQAVSGNDNLGAVAQSRLNITVNVIFTNKLEPSKSFDKNFSRFQDFSSEVEFSTIEEELVEEITQQLSENILNEAISNW